jgi:hypothetical protein
VSFIDSLGGLFIIFNLFRAIKGVSIGFRRCSSKFIGLAIRLYCNDRHLIILQFGTYYIVNVNPQIGNICANTISGQLLGTFDGWASPFYFFGVCGVLWFVCFVSFQLLGFSNKFQVDSPGILVLQRSRQPSLHHQEGKRLFAERAEAAFARQESAVDSMEIDSHQRPDDCSVSLNKVAQLE